MEAKFLQDAADRVGRFTMPADATGRDAEGDAKMWGSDRSG